MSSGLKSKSNRIISYHKMRTLVCVLILYLSIKSIDAYRRIVGGRDAALAEFPYVAVWGTFDDDNNNRIFRMHCTCSFLLPNWALTASHCIDKNTTSLGVVMYGNVNPGQRSNFTNVLQTYRHPAYFDSSEADFGPFLKNDIGLIRTDTIQLLRYAVISAVDYKTMIGHEVFVAGFGGTNDTERIDDVIALNKTLQVFRGMINTCSAADPVLVSRICVSSSCKGIALICGGDSGGPVIHASGIVGINSMSVIGCDTYHEFKRIHKHSLAQYSSSVVQAVSPVADWLYMTMKNNN